MINIIWSCPLDSSGYSQSGRDYVMALSKNGFNVQYETPMVSTLIDGTGIDRATRKKLCTLIENKVSEPYIRVFQSVPDRFSYDRNAILNIGYTVVETERIPERWVFSCNQMDAIFTASDFCRRILMRNGVIVPVFVIPHCHNGREWSSPGKYNIENLKGFNFLFCADFTPRKGWKHLLKAYCEEFKPDEDVSLTFKVYYGNFSETCQERCKRAIREVAYALHYRPNIDTAPIYFYGHCLPNNCVPRFINTFDCVVSPHSGEGWGLLCSQGMMLGKPVIATKYSGNLEFMTTKNSLLVPVGRYQTVPEDMVMINPNYEGQTWPVIDTDKLRAAMRRAVTEREEMAKLGRRAKRDISQKCSYKAVSSLVERTIQELLAAKEKEVDTKET